jgi:hypothetical protein
MIDIKIIKPMIINCWIEKLLAKGVLILLIKAIKNKILRIQLKSNQVDLNTSTMNL